MIAPARRGSSRNLSQIREATQRGGETGECVWRASRVRQWGVCGVVAMVLVLLAAPGLLLARDLSFEERVLAQEAIERVYYSHQIGTTQSFEQSIPREVLERKVRNTLKQSAALEKFWSSPISAEALRRELERIAAASRFPERLQEIYQALGRDPVLIQECFIRAVLADRTTRNFLAFDARIQGPSRQEAEDLRARLAQGTLAPLQDHPRRSLEDLVLEQDGERSAARGIGKDGKVVLSVEEFRNRSESVPHAIGEVGPVRESREAFSVSVLLSRSARRIQIATYTVPKIAWEPWWEGVSRDLKEMKVRSVAAITQLPTPGSRKVDVAGSESMRLDELASTPNGGCIPADSWTRGLEEDFPDARAEHTAVWTGTEMLIWGGAGPGDGSGNVIRGNRYDPLTDSWRMISNVNAPTTRRYYTAVWTGSRMVIWGGVGTNGVGSLDTGGRYDPIADTWSAVSAVGAPTARFHHTAVWSGSRMVIWGGQNDVTLLAEGGQYDPIADTWQGMSASGLAPRIDHSAVWTGNRMIVWGGQSLPGTTIRGDGGLYDPVADLWTLNITSVNQPANRRRHTALWTGNRMIIWGGESLDETFDDGKLYDPIGRTWTSMPSFAPGRTKHRSVWTGNKMILWGGQDPSGNRLGTGGMFDPALGTWQATSLSGAPTARIYHTMVWTGSRAIVWGGDANGGPLPLRDGARFDPATNSWTPTSVGSEGPALSTGSGAVWSGTYLIVWGGQSVQTSNLTNTGSRYDPVTDAWSPTTTAGAPSPRAGFFTVWAGTRMLVWGGVTDPFPALTDTGGRYDPIADSWSPTTLAGAPAPRDGAKAIWTGSEMILMGSGLYSPPQFNGYRYNPTADSWTPVSTAGQPEPREFFSMVWTGAELLVWGGRSLLLPVGDLNTGARYNPVNDHWTAMSTNNAPSVRSYHSAVWTGTEMLIWGGMNTATTTFLADGGRYHPVGGPNTHWSGLAGSNPPSARGEHVAVWTGTEMIVWGGYDANSSLSNGKRYNPATEVWTPTSSVGSPPRLPFQGFWTGQFMLLWSASPLGAGVPAVHLGALYAPYQIDPDADGDGVFACSGDCDDSDPTVHPGAAEICNGVDDNCDDVKDEGFADLDADGSSFCVDCNDADPGVHPGAPEICNGVDDDCDTGTDNVDFDGDGYSQCGVDCNDGDPGAWSHAPEVTGLDVITVSPLVFGWQGQDALVGPGVSYDVPSGDFGPSAGIAFSSAACLGSTATPQYTDTRPDPLVSKGYWFLVRSRNSCGDGTYGVSSVGVERLVPACP